MTKVKYSFAFLVSGKRSMSNGDPSRCIVLISNIKILFKVLSIPLGNHDSH